MSLVLQPQYCRNNIGLGCSAFARHYLRNHYCFLLLRVLRCFSSPRSPPDKSGWPCFTWPGCPIRKSPDYRLFAPTRSLSQLITSFIASESQGIHRTPLVTFFTFDNFLKKIASGALYYSKKIFLLFLACSLPICQWTLYRLPLSLSTNFEDNSWGWSL